MGRIGLSRYDTVGKVLMTRGENKGFLDQKCGKAFGKGGVRLTHIVRPFQVCAIHPRDGKSKWPACIAVGSSSVLRRFMISQVSHPPSE